MAPGAFVLAFAKRPWDWVESDCCRMGAAWCVEQGYADPIAALGLRYNSERSALRVIRKGGGLLNLWTRGMNAIGMPEGDDARPGDLGILEMETAEGVGEAVGICMGDRWATLGLRGLNCFSADILGLWRP